MTGLLSLESYPNFVEFVACFFLVSIFILLANVISYISDFIRQMIPNFITILI